MNPFIVLAIIVAALTLASGAGRAIGPARAKKSPAATAPLPNSQGREPEGTLVAVIAAAIAAASDAAPDSFRITSIAPSGSRGFNTPVWGHIDRKY
jgi:hypothetical protein